MLARNGGEWWDSTEQTAMVLFGLVDYLAASHELESDFTADVLVNGHSAGQRHFTPADALSGAIHSRLTSMPRICNRAATLFKSSAAAAAGASIGPRAGSITPPRRRTSRLARCR